MGLMCTTLDVAFDTCRTSLQLLVEGIPILRALRGLRIPRRFPLRRYCLQSRKHAL
jgi:hypothetical protein